MSKDNPLDTERNRAIQMQQTQNMAGIAGSVWPQSPKKRRAHNYTDELSNISRHLDGIRWRLTAIMVMVTATLVMATLAALT